MGSVTPGGRTLAFSPDSQILAAGLPNPDGKIRLWNVDDGTLLNTLSGFFIVNAVVFSPDGATLLSAGADRPGDELTHGAIKFWRVSDGALLQLYDEQTGGDPSIPHPFGVPCIDVSPDSSRLGFGRWDATVVMARMPSL